jgi:biotin carboxyl carrier protein
VENVRPDPRIETLKRGTALVAGERVDYQWDFVANAIKATVGGREYTLETQEIRPGVYWFAWNGRSIEAAVLPTNQGYVVSIFGQHIPVEFLDSTKALRRAAHGHHEGIVEVRAPMPGKIVRILAAEGAQVDAHQGIVVMEAMKMQNEIRAPKQGKIVRLAVEAGSALNSADLIALIE